MCIKADKKKGIVVLKLNELIYPEEVINTAIKKTMEKFKTAKVHKEGHYIITIKGGSEIDLELLGYEFANYLLYFSKHI